MMLYKRDSKDYTGKPWVIQIHTDYSTTTSLIVKDIFVFLIILAGNVSVKGVPQLRRQTSGTDENIGLIRYDLKH